MFSVSKPDMPAESAGLQNSMAELATPAGVQPPHAGQQLEKLVGMSMMQTDHVLHKSAH